MRSLMGVGPLVNMIDAFDECMSYRRKGILEVLSNGDFPDNLRFIITTCTEKDVMASLADKRHVLTLDLNKLGAGTIFSDIKTYTRHRLDRHRFRDVGIDEFVSKAGGLFQWAATACNYICHDNGTAGIDQQERFSLILSRCSDLNALYRTVLEAAFPREDSGIQAVKLVLTKVLVAAEPLSASVLKSLCIGEAEKHAVDKIIPYLASILAVSIQSIHPIHSSFCNFLIDPECSGKFWIDIKQGHQSLARASFSIMEKELCFNKCNIKSSHQLNSEIKQEQIDCISPALFYSSRFWANHLTAIAADNDIRAAVSHLLHKQLLFWLEILSIKQALKFAIFALYNVIQWKVCYKYYIAS
jgi:hypothetical protein